MTEKEVHKSIKQMKKDLSTALTFHLERTQWNRLHPVAMIATFCSPSFKSFSFFGTDQKERLKEAQEAVLEALTNPKDEFPLFDYWKETR